MRLRVYGAAVLLGWAVFWIMGGTAREKPLVSAGLVLPWALLERDATAFPDDPEPTRKLAQAYLDATQPGLAVVLLTAATPAVRADARVQHVYARALLDQGHNGEALDAEERVMAACRAAARGASAGPGCDDVLVASASRRIGILEALLAFGVDDTQAHPEASLAAYQSATRNARVSLQ